VISSGDGFTPGGPDADGVEADFHDRHLRMDIVPITNSTLQLRQEGAFARLCQTGQAGSPCRPAIHWFDFADGAPSRGATFGICGFVPRAEPPHRLEARRFSSKLIEL
jgi:hypothetical protein